MQFRAMRMVFMSWLRAGKKCVLELHKAMDITEEVLRHMIIRKGVC